LIGDARPQTWLQVRALWSRRLSSITASDKLSCFGDTLRDMEASILVENQSEWWVTNRRRRWLQHVENMRDTNETIGDLYWLYAMLAMLLELESSIEDSAFGMNFHGEFLRERRRWRSECELLEEAVRESIGLEPAPHRIVLDNERGMLTNEAFSHEEQEQEGEEDGDVSSTSSEDDSAQIHPVSFSVERRESIPLRVVDGDETNESNEDAEEMFSHNTIPTPLLQRRSSVDFSRGGHPFDGHGPSFEPRSRRNSVNNIRERHNSMNDISGFGLPTNHRVGSFENFGEPTDILERGDVANTASLREAYERIARASRENVAASVNLESVISHLAQVSVLSSTSHVPRQRRAAPTAPPSSSSSSRETVQNANAEENIRLKQKVSHLTEAVGRLEKSTTCVVCYERPRSCALLPCGHFSLCTVCADKSRQAWVQRCNEEEDERDTEDDEDDIDMAKKIFFRCPSCRANVSGVLQLFPP
jgi:hypothetical protein